MQERAFKNPKITFLWNTVVEDLAGPAAGNVMTVPLRNVTTGALTDGLVDGLFVAIGYQPDTALVKGQVEVHPNEYIKVIPGTTQTSVPGVFAAGDVRTSPTVKRSLPPAPAAWPPWRRRGTWRRRVWVTRRSRIPGQLRGGPAGARSRCPVQLFVPARGLRRSAALRSARTLAGTAFEAS